MTSGLKLALRQQGSNLGVASGPLLELLLFCFLNENSFAVFSPPPLIIKGTYVCSIRLRQYGREVPKSSLPVADTGGKLSCFYACIHTKILLH